MSKKGAERQREWRNREREKGRVPMQYWVTQEEKDALTKLLDELRAAQETDEPAEEGGD